MNKLKIISLSFLFLLLPSMVNSMELVTTDRLRIWSNKTAYTKPSRFHLNKGDTIKVLKNRSKEERGKAPVWATSFKVLDKHGKEYPGIYYLSSKLLKRNTLEFKARVGKLVPNQKAATQKICDETKPYAESSELLNAGGFSLDLSYDFLTAETYARTSNFGNPDDLQIITRQQWKAKKPKDKLKKLSKPSEIVVHHTVTPSHFGPKKIQELHQNGRKWDDVGYNYLIGYDAKSSSWKVYEGRMIVNAKGENTLAEGAHAKHFNHKSIGIAVIGNFAPKSRYNKQGYNPSISTSKKQIPKNAIILLGLLIEKLMKKYPEIEDVKAHGADSSSTHSKHMNYVLERVPHANKDCPGEGVIHVVGAFRHRYFPNKGKRKPGR